LERWSTWTQHDIEADKAIVDTVNALIAVAAFIAGVQSSIILLTITLEQTPLGRATNTVAFVGLVLDVVGTFLGVIHAIVLQRRIKENTAVLTAMTQVNTTLKAVQNLQDTAPSPEKVTSDQLREIGIDDPERHVQRAQELHDMLEDRFHRRNVLGGPFGLAQSVLQVVVLANSAVGINRIRVDTVLKSLFGLGHTPLLAMALGVVALVVSVITFAAESAALPSQVWVSCVAVLAGVIGLSLLPITYETLKILLSPSNPERLPE
jgi:hypothetical protein